MKVDIDKNQFINKVCRKSGSRFSEDALELLFYFIEDNYEDVDIESIFNLSDYEEMTKEEIFKNETWKEEIMVFRTTEDNDGPDTNQRISDWLGFQYIGKTHGGCEKKGPKNYYVFLNPGY